MKENIRYGKLTTIKKVSKGQKKPKISARWLCKCDCGGEKIVNESSLYGGHTISCGCFHHLKDSDYNEKTKLRIKENIKIDKNGCWIWQGSKHRQGYGNIAYRNKPMLAHRISWIIFKGEIPSSIYVCHTCDVTSCCNPDHLFLGTQKENMDDAHDKGKYENRNISKNRRIKLNFEQVQEIKKLHKQGMKRKDLQIKYSVSQTCIAKILTGVSWKINWTEEL